MQKLQMNPPWECGLISLINSYLAFSFFHISTTTILKLGVTSFNYEYYLVRLLLNLTWGRGNWSKCSILNMAWSCIKLERSDIIIGLHQLFSLSNKLIRNWYKVNNYEKYTIQNQARNCQLRGIIYYWRLAVRRWEYIIKFGFLFNVTSSSPHCYR